MSAGTRVLPQSALELSLLPLADLRAYRQDLVDEEGRVSYWRRILQARLDLLRATGDCDVLAKLQGILASAGSAGSVGSLPRHASMHTVLPADDVPPLPDLATLWDAPAQAAQGTTSYDEMHARLLSAERQLSAYRSVLHVRIDLATDELITRYAQDPRRCLGALAAEHRFT